MVIDPGTAHWVGYYDNDGTWRVGLKSDIDPNGGGGSGLPPQWTADNAHGDVIAAVDDPTKTPFTIQATTGQTAPLLDVKDESSNDVVLLNEDGSGQLGALGKLSSGALPFSNGAGVFDPLSTVPTDGGWYSFGYRAGGPDFTLSRADGQGSFAEIVIVYQNLDLSNSVAQTQLDTYAQAQDASSNAKVLFSSAAGNVGTTSAPHAPGGSVGAEFDGSPNGYTDEAFFVDGNPRLDLLVTDTSTEIWARAQPGQTVPLFELLDENVVKVARITPNGTPIFNAHVEPADGDLNNSDFAFWSDDTPGATVLHCKAKDRAGTVRNGQIALT